MVCPRVQVGGFQVGGTLDVGVGGTVTVPGPPDVGVGGTVQSGVSGGGVAGGSTDGAAMVGTSTSTSASTGGGAGTGTGAGTGRIEIPPLPIGITLGFQFGYIAPMRNRPLQRATHEWSAQLSWVPTHWFSLDARVGWMHAAQRSVDLNHDGRNDTDRADRGVTAVSVTIGPRLRLFYDSDTHEGWSLGVQGGVWIPTSGFDPALRFDPRPVGAIFDAAVARHVGFVFPGGGSVGLALELRGRTGVGAIGDLQTLTVGMHGAWEGNTQRGRNRGSAATPGIGHTFEGNAGGSLFFDGGRRPNGSQFFGTGGYTAVLGAGLVLTPGFELGGRIGYMNRAGVTMVDDLSAFLMEGGPRGRLGFLALQGLFGYAATYGGQRDEVLSGPYAGFVFQGRAPLGTQRDVMHIVLGVTGRFMLGPERALDSLSFNLGLEFEGGGNQAMPFPTLFAPAPPTATVVAGVAGVHTVSASASTGANVAVGGSVSSQATLVPVHVEVMAPLRVALSVGPGFNSGMLFGRALDGMHADFGLTAAIVPTPWLSLELRGSILNAGFRRVYDINTATASLPDPRLFVSFAATLGPRFRLLSDGPFRHGWSFGFDAGILGNSLGVGPLVEAVIGRHLATIADTRMSFEIGLDLRARTAFLFDGGGRSDALHAVTVGLSAAWEGNVVARGGEPRTGWAAGETLGFEAGYMIFPEYRVRGVAQNVLSSSGYGVGVHTGIVLVPGFEWSLRASFLGRTNTNRDRDTAEILVAETGPRFRWGFAYADVDVGYAGTFGALRDAIAGVPTLSTSLGVRLGLTGVGRHAGAVFGVRGRVGLGDERAYDSVMFTAGVEFEGGNQQARPFPTGVINAMRDAGRAADDTNRAVQATVQSVQTVPQPAVGGVGVTTPIGGVQLNVEVRPPR